MGHVGHAAQKAVLKLLLYTYRLPETIAEIRMQEL